MGTSGYRTDTLRKRNSGTALGYCRLYDGIPDICEIDTSGEEIRWIWKLGNGDNEWSNIEAITFGETATDMALFYEDKKAKEEK